MLVRLFSRGLHVLLHKFSRFACFMPVCPLIVRLPTWPSVRLSSQFILEHFVIFVLVLPTSVIPGGSSSSL